MPYRFVHAADIHLDSPLRSLALRDPELAELIGNASRRALEAIVKLCLDEQVDALLIAGDLYDGDQTSMKTARFLASQVGRLVQAGIAVFIIRGNHDARSMITAELSFPPSVKIFTGRAEAFRVDRGDGELPVMIHGISFAKPQAPESLLPKYKAPVEGAVNIGMMHTSLAGVTGHDPYAPCLGSDLDAFGYQYWALGHIHLRSVTLGKSTVVMPGIPQGRDINEAGAKSVTLVTIADDRTVQIEERITSVAQFERVPVSLDRIEDWPDMVTSIVKVMERARSAAASEHLVVRLALHGTTPLAWQMRRDLDLVKQAVEEALPIGRSWIEKIEFSCTAPGVTSPVGADPLLDLRGLMRDDIGKSPGYTAAAADIARELCSQLPPELRGILGDNEESFRVLLSALIDDGTEDVLARLHAATREEAN